MSDFMPKKVYLWGILKNYFIQKKSAAEAYRILVETYGDHTLLETNVEIGLKASKIMILMLKMKNALTPPKSLKTKNWKH